MERVKGAALAVAALLLFSICVADEEEKKAPAKKKKRFDGPAVGDLAPDFTLPDRDTPGRTVTLSDFRGKKPVVLIFGSYT